MRIIDAVWEKRNLGVETHEIELDGSEDLQNVRDVLAYDKSRYCVVKSPIGRLDLYEELSTLGFHYAESLFTLRADTLKIADSGSESDTCFRLALDADVDELLQAVESGLFTTDRIALDPVFGPRIAARRYCNWIRDEIARNADLVILLFEGMPVGFTLLREADLGTCKVALCGMYPPYQSRGLSGLIVRAGLERTRAMGQRVLLTPISSNNPASLKAHIKAGCVPDTIQYVFVRHDTWSR
ncbi:MAG: hypothetical protein LBS17_00780 [Actinomycetes bacterium]|jgi:hypothetical protein|nr:hypothetical protein [Actinomycetes bacterium]